MSKKTLRREKIAAEQSAKKCHQGDKAWVGRAEAATGGATELLLGGVGGKSASTTRAPLRAEEAEAPDEDEGARA